MFLPIGDIPDAKQTPYANYLLIGINVGVFLFILLPLTVKRPDFSDPMLEQYFQTVRHMWSIQPADFLRQVTAYDLFIFRHGFKPADPQLSDLVFSLFLHGGWLHLLGNMLFLWIFGDNVEERLGHWLYLLVYLGTGIFSNLFYALFMSGSGLPLVGASGAISGVLGCYFVWFPRNKVKTFIFLFPLIMTTILIPARFVLGVFLVLDNLLPFLLTRGNSDGSGIAHGAHIGGFLAGMGVALLLERRSSSATRGRTTEEEEN